MIDGLKQAITLTPLDMQKIDELRRISKLVGRSNFIKELKAEYVRSSSVLLDSLQASFESGDAPSMIQSLHKLKSGCGNLGLMRLHGLCDLAERRLREGAMEREHLSTLIERIRNDYSDSLQLLPED